MKKGTFILDGVGSQEINSLIQERPSIPSAGRKIRMRPIPGHDGDFIYDEEAYNNVSFTLSCYTTGKSESEILAIKNEIVTLFDSGDYIDLQLYSDPEHIYEVIMDENGIEFTPSGETPMILPYSVTFSARPFKRIIQETKMEAKKSMTVFNPTAYNAKPIIKIYGTGDIDLYVNDTEYPLRSIDDHVVLDCNKEDAYKEVPDGLISRNHRMFNIDFPVLDPGTNTIYISGDATHFEVDPKWKDKV